MADIADQVQWDAPQASAQTPQATPEASGVQWDQDKFQGTGQTIQAGAEGALRGLVSSPLANLAETKLGLASEEGIKGRQAAHPIVSGIGEGAGLVGGALTGTGEAAALEGIGKGAAELAGLKGATTYGAKIGESIVKNAAEMAAFQSQDEIGKTILHDPDAGAQSAIANIGLAAALGGAGGALFTGAVSPLWKATAGPKVEELLNFVKNTANGGSKLIMPQEIESSAKTLGIDLDPVMRSGMSQDPKAEGFFSDLRRGEHETVLNGINDLHNKISNSVMEPLGITPQSVLEYSENQGGKDIRDAFQAEVKEKYDPRALEMQQRDAEAHPIAVPDEARLQRAGNIMEKGIQDVGTDSPYYKEYSHYADRLLAKNTIGEIDQLKSEIFGRIKAAKRAGDDNTVKALTDIRNSLSDFQSQQIESGARAADKKALANTKIKGMPRVNVGELPSAKPGAAELIARRQAANQNYAKYANTMDTVMDHLGLGEFHGTKGALSKVTEKLTPEQVYKKFTIDGNADLIPFMQQHFPNTYAKMLETERKEMVKPAILSAAKKGENPIDVKKLNDIIQKKMAGQSEYVKAVLPPQVVERAKAGQVLSNAIPSPRDSGTPAGLAKIFRMMPAGAMSAISWATGHGVVGGLMAGEMAQRLGKDAPEAMKLAWLKYLGSDKPVSAEGFKAAVDYMQAAQKGARNLSKGTEAVFKPGLRVLATSQMPSPTEISKLDKLVAANDPKNERNIQQTQTTSPLGHYLPEHQTAVTQASLQSLQYLKTLRPQPHPGAPLDAQFKPTAEQESRYNRALTIAQQPLVVLQRIKDGTVQPSDLQDLKAMSPAVYTAIAQKMSNEMINQKAGDEPIPYKTRLGISLFLGQPMDSTMQPASIQATQMVFQQKAQRQSQQPQGKVGGGKKGSSNLGKSNASYKTATQAAEGDRGNRD